MKLSLSPAIVVFSVTCILSLYATVVFGFFHAKGRYLVEASFVPSYVFPVSGSMHEHHVMQVMKYSDVIDFPGGVMFLLIPIFVAWIYSRRRLAILLFALMSVTMMSAFVIKELTAIPRPNTAQLVQEVGYAFPSAHAALVFTTFWGYVLIALFATKKLVERYVWALCIFAYGVFAVSIAYTRLVLGVHWVFDILGAFTLSLSFASCVAILYTGYFRDDDEQDMILSELSGKNPQEKGMGSSISPEAVPTVSENNNSVVSPPILGNFK